MKEMEFKKDEEQNEQPLTESEKERLKEIRKFEDLEKDSLSYDIVLAVDRLRQQRITTEIIIEKRLTDMIALLNKYDRLMVQAVSGEITERLDDNTTMNKEEVLAHARQQKFNARSEAYSIYRDLAQLRGLVGKSDLMRNPIMTLEEYDEYAQSVLDEVKNQGYNFMVNKQ